MFPPTASTLPTTLDLFLYQGDDFAMTVTVTNPDGSPYDLTGAVPAADIRQYASAPDPPLASFSCAVVPGQPGNVPNQIVVHLADADSAGLCGSLVYDLQITDENLLVTTLLAGTIEMTEQVTRTVGTPLAVIESLSPSTIAHGSSGTVDFTATGFQLGSAQDAILTGTDNIDHSYNVNMSTGTEATFVAPLSDFAVAHSPYSLTITLATGGIGTPTLADALTVT